MNTSSLIKPLSLHSPPSGKKQEETCPNINNAAIATTNMASTVITSTPASTTQAPADTTRAKTPPASSALPSTQNPITETNGGTVTGTNATGLLTSSSSESLGKLSVSSFSSLKEKTSSVKKRDNFVEDVYGSSEDEPRINATADIRRINNYDNEKVIFYF